MKTCCHLLELYSQKSLDCISKVFKRFDTRTCSYNLKGHTYVRFESGSVPIFYGNLQRIKKKVENVAFKWSCATLCFDVPVKVEKLTFQVSLECLWTYFFTREWTSWLSLFENRVKVTIVTSRRNDFKAKKYVTTFVKRFRPIF